MKRLVLLAAAALAAAFAVARAAHALPPGIAAVFGQKLVRAEVVVVENGSVHDYRIDRGRIASVAPDSLVLDERDGTSQTVPLDPNATVTVNGLRAPLARLRVGMRATTIRDGDAPATTVVATGRRRLR